MNLMVGPHTKNGSGLYSQGGLAKDPQVGQKPAIKAELSKDKTHMVRDTTCRPRVEED